jgi:uncharacterized protein YcaQ
LTEAGIADHCRFDGGARGVRPHVESLVAEGRLRQVELDDGGPPVYVTARAVVEGAPAASVLLSPFDNLLWDRAFLRRLFGFEHVIEVYKRAPERVYGYYVLPLLAGDRFVGRADVKADRKAGVLRIQRFTPEPKVRRRLDVPLEQAASRLARALGLQLG